VLALRFRCSWLPPAAKVLQPSGASTRRPWLWQCSRRRHEGFLLVQVANFCFVSNFGMTIHGAYDFPLPGQGLSRRRPLRLRSKRRLRPSRAADLASTRPRNRARRLRASSSRRSRLRRCGQSRRRPRSRGESICSLHAPLVPVSSMLPLASGYQDSNSVPASTLPLIMQLICSMKWPSFFSFFLSNFAC